MKFIYYIAEDVAALNCRGRRIVLPRDDLVQAYQIFSCITDGKTEKRHWKKGMAQVYDYNVDGRGGRIHVHAPRRFPRIDTLRLSAPTDETLRKMAGSLYLPFGDTRAG